MNSQAISLYRKRRSQYALGRNLTIDRDAGWRITDVGGLQNAVPVK